VYKRFCWLAAAAALLACKPNSLCLGAYWQGPIVKKIESSCGRLLVLINIVAWQFLTDSRVKRNSRFSLYRQAASCRLQSYDNLIVNTRSVSEWLVGWLAWWNARSLARYAPLLSRLMMVQFGPATIGSSSSIHHLQGRKYTHCVVTWHECTWANLADKRHPRVAFSRGVGLDVPSDRDAAPEPLGLSVNSQQYSFLSEQTSHQQPVLSSQNKPAPAISHQPNELAEPEPGWVQSASYRIGDDFDWAEQVWHFHNRLRQ
jgi:hypothetical protein